MEQKLDFSVAQFQRMVEHSSVGMIHATLDLDVIYCNTTILDWVECKDVQEFKQKPLWDYFTEESRNQIRKQFQLRRGGQSSTYEVEMRSNSGRLLTVSISGSPIFGENGEVESAIATFSDITKIRRSMRVLNTIIEAVPDGVLVIGKQEDIVAYNKRFADLFDIPAEIMASPKHFPVLEHVLTKFAHPEEFVRQRDQAMIGDLKSSLEFELKDGRFIELNRTRETLTDDALRVICVRDITERKKVEARLLHADRMSIVGTLSAGVAHEVNNPLTHLVLGLEMVSEQLEASSASGISEFANDLQSQLDPLIRSASRISDIVKDLRAFSHSGDEKTEPLDLVKTIESTLPMINGELRQKGQLELQLESVPLITANEGRITQIMLNLMINALHAMSSDKRDTNILKVATGRDSRGWAFVSVSDTGVGISKDLQKRIFEPFFTTKPVGAGTGLGLSICYNLIQRFGGEIEVMSELGHGATFRVYFPPTTAPELISSEAPQESAEKSNKTILFVDDERAICDMVHSALSSQCTLLTASNGEAALRLLIENGQDIDLVICDLMMPIMNGMELFDRIQTLDPTLAQRFVFVTGGAMNPATQEFIDTVNRPVFYKPFSLKGLRKIIAEHP